MRSFAPWLGLALLSLGCTTTFHASTTQANPLVAFPDQATHRSEKLSIDVRDMDLPVMPTGFAQFKLRQSAYFAVVSRERLRFHVMLVHKWQEIADPTSWNARLEDDQGRVYYPETKELSYDDHVTQMWDHERRQTVRNVYGDVVKTLNEGDAITDSNGNVHYNHNERVPLDSVDVFQGSGDFTFHGSQIFHRGVKRLTLSLERQGVVYKFTWNLVDLPGADPAEGDVAAAKGSI